MLALILTLSGCAASGDTVQLSEQFVAPLGDGLADDGVCPTVAPKTGAPGKAGPLPTFTRHIISEANGAAYIAPADLNDDGYPELLLTSLSEGASLWRFFDVIKGQGPLSSGAAHVLSRDGGAPAGELGTFSQTTIFDKDDNIDFPNQSTLFDINNDGVKDWVVGAGFLVRPEGNIAWMPGRQGPDGLTFGDVQKLPLPNKDQWYHVALPIDLNRDGYTDFITTSHQGKIGDDNSLLEWFENDGIPGRASFTHHIISRSAGGSLVELHDLDDDGDLDIVAPQFFYGESLVWFEQVGDKGTSWEKHVINDDTGRGFEVKFADMNGDGRMDMVYGNHNHQLASATDEQVMGIYWFEVPDASIIHSLSNWSEYKHTVFEGFHVPGDNPEASSAPGMLNVGDIDGDGDVDVTASGDGDPGLYLFIQQEGGFFDQVELDNGYVNSGEQHMIDMDGDCDLDIVWAVFGDTRKDPLAFFQDSLDSYVFVFLQN